MPDLNPGHGYIIRELLGAGYWKQVHRAVVKGEWRDKALLTYKREMNPAALVAELRPVLQLAKLQPPPENIALVDEIFVGDDGRAYIVEELLYQPLDRIGPLAASERFLRIARDLCAGLSVLHGMKLVHRDLKLDNCGIDYSDRAKIFDLGNVTSEGSEVKGTIISRAPELFAAEGSPHTRPADIWALGAVLFALKEGGYPFVSQWEVRDRPRDGDERADFDEKVKRRYLAANAEGELREKLNHGFPPGPRRVLTRMLDFRPEDRISAKDAQAEFATLITSWLRPAEARPGGDSERVITELESYLSAVVEDRVALSNRQWQKAAEAVEQLEKTLGKQCVSRLLDLAKRVRERRAAGEIAS